MGTRADFYVGRGEAAEWVGSIAWDGYPDGIHDSVLQAADEVAYSSAVSQFLRSRDDATLPEMGWPWPWNDSCLTDYAYAFEAGKVLAARFGRRWFDPGDGEPDDYESESKECVFPDMSSVSHWTLGPRSGVLVFRS